jgi:RNA polymerase sigma-70 factor (ECF subfamily)
MYTLLRTNIDREHDLQLAAFDAHYLERLQAADLRTEQHFVGYFSELIRLKLRSRLSSPEAIEDARQETFVRVFALIRSRDGIRQPERLGALVNSVCNNVLLEQYRSKSRREAPLDEEMEASCIAEGPGPADVVELDDTERLVGKILSELPERDRRILRAVLLEERDKDQVCTELGISRDYLRLLVHRAKQSFKSFYLKRLRDKGDL